ncbi:hypothetical protein [Qipengyuania gaetbuli]|uniref:hypothetical protein n=1 Tax=Qipengyuania gaetbuli TaxID=266952 RepID=UPI001CFCA4A2|nr:hypothetical protein [Qipengyuania gaetbuli]
MSSLTVPNAKCPVCGDQVFFYWNDKGSRVFFDDLGPPWPKHPCTDNPAPSGPRVRVKPPAPEYTPWRDAGWIPAIYEKSKREDGWNVLYLTLLETDQPLRVLSDVLRTPERGGLIYIQPWDEKFWTSLEFLDEYMSPERIWGWKYDKWFMTSMMKALDERRKKSVPKRAQKPKGRNRKVRRAAQYRSKR